MKTIILSILLLGFSAVAKEESTTSPTEASASLNCEHYVPGTTCPAKNSTSSCQTIFCDSQVKSVSDESSEEGSK